MYMLYVIMIHCLLNEIDGHTSLTVFLQYLVLRRFRFRHFVIGFVNIWGIGIIRVILFQCIFYLYRIAIHVGCDYRHEACIVFRLMIVVWTVNFFPRKNSKKQHNYNVSKKVLPRTYTDIHARQNPNHPNNPTNNPTNHPNQRHRGVFSFTCSPHIARRREQHVWYLNKCWLSSRRRSHRPFP
jgi:hypothetical protein